MQRKKGAPALFFLFDVVVEKFPIALLLPSLFVLPYSAIMEKKQCDTIKHSVIIHSTTLPNINNNNEVTVIDDDDDRLRF